MALAFIPRFVVVDTRDGYTFWRGPDGQLFDRTSAWRFAKARNEGVKDPGHFADAYQVFTLTRDTGAHVRL